MVVTIQSTASERFLVGIIIGSEKLNCLIVWDFKIVRYKIIKEGGIQDLHSYTVHRLVMKLVIPHWVFHKDILGYH